MESFQVRSVLQATNPRLEVVESDFLRTEAVLVHIDFPTLEAATEFAVSKVQQMLRARFPSLRSVRVTERSPNFTVLLLSPITQLIPTLEAFTNPLPWPTMQSSWREEGMCPIHESRDERMYSSEKLVKKVYKWFSCETVNRALAEAVTLAGVPENGHSLVEIVASEEDSLGPLQLSLILEACGVNLTVDICKRREDMSRYRELQLVDYLTSLATTLHSAHRRVSSK